MPKTVNSKPQFNYNPEIGPLSGTTTPSQSGPRSDGSEGYSAFPKAPALLEPHHQII